MDYYIPSENEVHDYYQNRYFTSEPAYWKLKDFFDRVLKYGREEADDLCAFIYQEFAKGKMLSEITRVLVKDGMLLSSDRQAEKFASLMADANNHTRMFELKGHMPVEMTESRQAFCRV